MSSLAGKSIWIIGASSGIGEAVARALAKENVKLALSARSDEKLASLVEELRPTCPKVISRPVDVTDRTAVLNAYEAVCRQLDRVDIIFMCAGTYVPTDPASFKSDEYKKIMNVNYYGTLHCVEAVLPKMIEEKSGYIVGVSSLVGYRGLPRSFSYGASKAALINFLEGLRFDLNKYKIDVSIVNPGFVKTPLTDKNDFPMPFLISAEEAASYIVEGMKSRKKEIHFPKKLSWLFKLLRILPYPLYERLVARQTGFERS